jgi:type I restriction enzyme S subunit
MVEELEIPLPPLPEQRRIAEVLDRAEALRAKRRAALAQLDSLTQAIFMEMFGDPATNPKGWHWCQFTSYC